ncbi:MAG: hypothetical protein AABY00_03085 [Nanoarchaeota archaeon]
MNEVTLLYLCLGGLGGLARALLGLAKAMARGERMKPLLFIISLIVSTIIGMLLGLFSENIDFHIALLAGYTGTDILENMFRTVIPKSVVFKQ